MSSSGVALVRRGNTRIMLLTTTPEDLINDPVPEDPDEQYDDYDYQE